MEHSDNNQQPDLSALVKSQQESQTGGGIPAPPQQSASQTEPDNGGGIIIDTPQNASAQGGGVPRTDVAPGSESDIDKKLRELDEEIEARRAAGLLQEQQQQDSQGQGDSGVGGQSDQTHSNGDSKASADAPVIINISKYQFGELTRDMTQDTLDRIEKAKVIKVNEVEERDVRVSRAKRAPEGSTRSLVQRKIKPNLVSMALPYSGYTVSVSGFTPNQMFALYQAHYSQNPITIAETEWSLMHSRIVTASVGDMDFDTFMKKTSEKDRNALMFAIGCASYLDNDNLTVTCGGPECQKEKRVFEHPYMIKHLLRTDKIDAKLAELIDKAVTASNTIESSRAATKDAPISRTLTFTDPVTDITFVIYEPSAYDTLNRSLKKLQEITDQKLVQASLLSVVVDKIYADDEDGNPVYYDSPIDITNIIYELPSESYKLLTRMLVKFGEDNGTTHFEFGLTDVECPVCGHMHKDLPIDSITDILFLRYQQENNTSVE